MLDYQVLHCIVCAHPRVVGKRFVELANSKFPLLLEETGPTPEEQPRRVLCINCHGKNVQQNLGEKRKKLQAEAKTSVSEYAKVRPRSASSFAPREPKAPPPPPP